MSRGVGEPILVYIQDFYCSERHEFLNSFLFPGRVYKAFKLSAQQVKSANGGYRIPLVDESGTVVDNFMMAGNNISSDEITIKVQEVQPEDLQTLELSEEDIDLVCDFYGLEQMTEEELDDLEAEGGSMDVVAAIPAEAKPDGIAPIAGESKNPFDHVDFASSFADRVDLDYAKYLLFEIREKKPGVFLSLFNLLLETKKSL